MPTAAKDEAVARAWSCALTKAGMTKERGEGPAIFDQLKRVYFFLRSLGIDLATDPVTGRELPPGPGGKGPDSEPVNPPIGPSLGAAPGVEEPITRASRRAALGVERLAGPLIPQPVIQPKTDVQVREPSHERIRPATFTFGNIVVNVDGSGLDGREVGLKVRDAIREELSRQNRIAAEAFRPA